MICEYTCVGVAGCGATLLALATERDLLDAMRNHVLTSEAHVPTDLVRTTLLRR